MRKYSALVSILLLVFCARGALGWEMPRWQPRLGLSASVGVWSPGGTDQDLFSASMGAGFSVLYWYNRNNQIRLTASYAPLKGKPEYWRDEWSAELEELADTIQAFDVFEVKGSLWTASLELRRLLPTDNKNFLYLGVGADLYYFGDVKGDYEVYVTGQPIKGTISGKRYPSYAGGLHLVPGMFFVFHRKVFMDVGVRVHFLYDGEDNPYWLEPFFSVSYRLF